jgi:hypothetical protein
MPCTPWSIPKKLTPSTRVQPSGLESASPPPATAGIVHQHGYGTKAFDDGSRQGDHFLSIAHVDRERIDVAGEPGARLGKARFVAVDQADAHPEAGQPPSDGKANTARRAGDDGELAASECGVTLFRRAHVHAAYRAGRFLLVVSLGPSGVACLPDAEKCAG